MVGLEDMVRYQGDAEPLELVVNPGQFPQYWISQTSSTGGNTK